MNSHVLIIDDSQVDRDLLRLRIPAPHGYTYTTAEDLTDAHKHFGGGGVHLIILDLHLPDMMPSGASAPIARLCEHAPVICITGLDLSAHPEISETCLSAGAEDVVEKAWINEHGDEFGRRMKNAIVKGRAGIHVIPSDIHSRVGVLQEGLLRFEQHFERMTTAQNKTLAEILAQATKTNGRVNALEAWRTSLATKAAWTVTLLTLVGMAGGFLFNGEIQSGVKHFLHTRPDPWTGGDMREWANQLREKNQGMTVPDVQHRESEQ